MYLLRFTPTPRRLRGLGQEKGIGLGVCDRSQVPPSPASKLSSAQPSYHPKLPLILLQIVPNRNLPALRAVVRHLGPLAICTGGSSIPRGKVGCYIWQGALPGKLLLFLTITAIPGCNTTQMHLLLVASATQNGDNSEGEEWLHRKGHFEKP